MALLSAIIAKYGEDGREITISDRELVSVPTASVVVWKDPFRRMTHIRLDYDPGFDPNIVDAEVVIDIDEGKREIEAGLPIRGSDFYWRDHPPQLDAGD